MSLQQYLAAIHAFEERMDPGPTREQQIETIMREQEQDAALALAPLRIKHGPDEESVEDTGIKFRKAGGGRLYIRKKIGSN